MANPEINLPVEDPETEEIGMEIEVGQTVPVPVDTTLTIRGEAADAKAAGDLIRQNAGNIQQLQTEVGGKVPAPEVNPQGESGQLLRSNGDGTTSWVQQGTPTQEQVAEAVSDWLDDHPEATTTVEDNAVTWAKMSREQQLMADNVPGSVQEPTFNADGSIQKIEHKVSGSAVRTDVFTITDAAVTEDRTLATGQKVTITTQLATKQTSFVYAGS